MATKPETPPQPKLPGKGALAAILGAIAATGLLFSIPQEEGTRNTAYKDIVGVWTICQGDTLNVHPGQVATDSECQQRLESQLVAHAAPVMECTPALKEDGRDYQRWAAVSLAYNIGTSAYCRSTVARKFNAHDWRGGCDAFLAWRFAGGREIAGLKARRMREREICLKGLT